MIKHFSVFYCGQVDHPECGVGAPRSTIGSTRPTRIASHCETAGMTAKHMAMPAFTSRREPAVAESVAGDDGNGG